MSASFLSYSVLVNVLRSNPFLLFLVNILEQFHSRVQCTMEYEDFMYGWMLTLLQLILVWLHGSKIVSVIFALNLQPCLLLLIVVNSLIA